jgi:TPR repeat protein
MRSSLSHFLLSLLGQSKAQRNPGPPRAEDSSETQNAGRLLAAARLGNPWSQFDLGLCYAKGQGVPQDLDEAVNWFRKAAEQGNSRAQFTLGFCYQHGYGIEQDSEEAVNWFRKAAKQGDPDAQSNLGYCYFHGEGVQQDFVKAAQWNEYAEHGGLSAKFRKSAEQGDARAQFYRVFPARLPDFVRAA